MFEGFLLLERKILMNHSIPFINKEKLEHLLPYSLLIPALKKAFQEDYTIPQRQHYDYRNPEAGMDSTLLLMPAWKVGNYLGVKIVTVSPNNAQYDLPAIQGIYILFGASKGQPLAYLEAKTLTARRTAAASALAASFLSKANSQSLLIIGTGRLAPELIQAHSTIRPIKQVYIWGRNYQKARQLAELFKNEKFQIQAVKHREAVAQKVDIISCATLSSQPVVFGKWLSEGQHIDLVGSYKPDMREADDTLIQRAALFIDTPAAMKESGDIAIPLQAGNLLANTIKGDLFSLCKGGGTGREKEEAITCFKSVGYALEDLAAAILAYERWK